jgi:pimeloyl-ACP methyl ester carboxylesterase
VDNGFVDVEGGRLYYETDGAGEPLLLIHGGLGSLRMWDGQVPAFAEHYRVIRYDTRGFGRSETDDVEFGNHEDVGAVLDHLGVESAHIVGQSRGGMIALDFILDNPHRAMSFVHVASGISGYEAARAGGDKPPFEEMEPLWEAKNWEALAELETQVWVDGWGQPADRVDPEIRRTVKDWIVENYQAEISEGKPQAARSPAIARLNSLRVPTLVLVGTADEAGGVEAGRYFAEATGADLVEFPGVAHMIQLEDPERFNRLVLEFFRGVASTRGTDRGPQPAIPES